MKCSIVILNWNGADMLRRYLPSVISAEYPDNVEVVIADNGSTDDSISVTEELIKGCSCPVRIVRLDRNYGFAAGYNMALQNIDAEYTILLNSDVEVLSDWLMPLIDYMDYNPDIAAVQPKVLSWTHKQNGKHIFEHAGAAGGQMDRLCYPFCRGRILGYVEEDYGQYDSIADVFWTTGACMCIRTSIYKELGGLDADFFAHMEEIDLCWRMLCRGYRLACVPQSVIYHLGGGALAYESPRKTYLNFRNCLLMIYKNLPTNHLVTVWIARFFLDYMAALHLLLTGKSANAWAVCRARFDFWRMKHTYKHKRLENINNAKVAYPAIIANRSILFDYYFRGARK